MAAAALRRALTAFTRPPDPDATDADLLRRFAAARSEDAFAALVRRHGPLVLGVCRRVVPDRHLADDAFQAAFVVLARRAGGIDPTRPLAPWLYGVAHRVALRARTMLGKRRKRETLAAAVPDVDGRSPEVDDAAAILDEEIAKLPAAVRDAVILCELQGLSRRAAAEKLGVAEGTLSSRLASARKTLAAKLQARGVVLPAALAGAAVVPPELASAAVSAGAGASLSSVVVSLADGASAMTLISKLKLTAVAVFFTLLSAGGVGPWGANETAAAPVPKDLQPDAGLLWVYEPAGGELVALTPAGREVRRVKLHGDGAYTYAFHGITPDGRFALFAGENGQFPAAEWFNERTRKGRLTLHRLPLFTAGKAEDTGIRTGFYNHFAFLPDGGILHSHNVAPAQDPPRSAREYVTTRYDADGKNGKKLDLPADKQAVGVLPGGEYLLHSVHQTEAPLYRFWRCKPGGEPKLISGEWNLESVELSPDGARLVGTHYRTHITKPDEEGFELITLDPATGKSRGIDNPTGVGFVGGFWSPDGRRVAVQFHRRERGRPLDKWSLTWRHGGGEIAVCDADGHNRQTVLKLDDPGEGVSPLDQRRLVGWFPRPIKAPVPKAKDQGLIWTHNHQTHTLTAYTPAGEEAKKLQLPEGVPFFGFTPDGKRMAFGGKKGKGSKDANGRTLHVGDISEECEGEDTGIGCKPADLFIWSPDARRMVRATKPRSWTTEWAHTLHDLTAETAEPVELPRDHVLAGWSADGKTWRVLHTNGTDSKVPPLRWLATPAGGKPELKPLCDGGAFEWLDPHPDGTRFLAAGVPHPKAKSGEAFSLFSVDGGKAEVMSGLGEAAAAIARWSPDGRRVACLRFAPAPVTRFPNDATLTVSDPDGTRETKLFTVPDDGRATTLVGWFPTPPESTREPIKAPVLKAKAAVKLPPKLDRPPEPPAALRRELFAWDEKYRHASEEKFAELEARAAELAKEYDTDYNQARVWFAVAHVAGQSGIDKHADRVRKYADKCLKLSGDPLDRASLYVSLSDCEQVGRGEFADKRRRAAGWLLTGYLELLAQELPDEKPELPGVMKFRILDGDGPDAVETRARHAAQLAAREQAVWVNDQIGRRDVLVMCFRNLYEPHPKVHGHGPDGPDELRKLAAARLPTEGDVDTLMKRVLPPK